MAASHVDGCRLPRVFPRWLREHQLPRRRLDPLSSTTQDPLLRLLIVSWRLHNLPTSERWWVFAPRILGAICNNAPRRLLSTAVETFPWPGVSLVLMSAAGAMSMANLSTALPNSMSCARRHVTRARLKRERVAPSLGRSPHAVWRPGMRR